MLIELHSKVIDEFQEFQEDKSAVVADWRNNTDQTSVSRHHGGPIKGSPDTSRTYSTIVMRGLITNYGLKLILHYVGLLVLQQM